jgi:purine-binding chemotaxis protein CheW
MSDDGPPPFPFGDLPSLPEPPADDSPANDAGPTGGLPSWLALAGLPEPDFAPTPDPDPPAAPYWPDAAEFPPPPAAAKDDDTLTDFPTPPAAADLAPTERMAFDPNPPPEDDLPLPPPFDPHLSELSPFDSLKSPPKPKKPSSKLQSKPKPDPRPPEEVPTLQRTPPPSAPLDIQPASAIWRTRRVPAAPRIEENGAVAVYRVTVRDEAARGYLNCKVAFPIPAGLKQVQASRKPQARKGNLHWNLGPLGPDDVVPLSVKLPVSLLGADPAAPRAFEVSYQPLPGARLIGELASPPVAAVNEPFAIKMRVSNTGELPTGPVTVRVADLSHGGPPVVVKVSPIDPGAFTTVTVELASDRPGRHEWFATVESPGSESAESTFSTEVVEAALALELRHEPMMRLDAEEEIAIVVTNTSAVPAKGVTAMLTMPEELTFAAAPGGEFDRALNLIGWLVGDIPPGESRTVVARLRGFAPGLVAIQARADGLIGTPVVSTSNIFVEVDARSTSSSLDKLLAAMQDAIPDDDDQPAAPRDRAAEAGARHVVFELGGTPYGVRIENVREVLRPAKVTPVPGTPDWLPGVANVRGDIISLVDLPQFLQAEDAAAARRGLLVAQSDDGQLVIGLLVDEIVGIRRFPPPQPVDADLVTDAAIVPYLDGVVEHQNRLVPILDLNALFASAELGAFQTV